MARQRPDSLWTMRKVQGLLSGKPGVSLEARLMQKPDTVYLPSQVTATPTGILSIGCGFLASQLGRMVDQETSTRVSRVEAGEGAQGIGNRALLLTAIFLEVT